MRQLFFIPAGKTLTLDIPGAHYHIWIGDSESAGVIEMDGSCDAEKVIAALEAQGIEWLPNHLHDPSIADRMTKLHELSGFPHLKPKRF